MPTPSATRPALLGETRAQERIEHLLTASRNHDAYRDACIGLVPTENRLSPLAKQIMTGDLSHRYLFQNPQWRYVGGKYLSQIEREAQALACELYGAHCANVRPLSGENCTNIVIHAVTPRDGAFYHLAMEDGGHFAAASVAERLTQCRHLLPCDPVHGGLDLEACARAFADVPPDVIYLDASMMLRAHPIRELRALVGPEPIIVYDASQVFGLLAGSTFQDPLGEGADILSGSTHKSLPGPQKGMILTRREDLMERIDATIFPGHVSNFHLHHVAALAVTLAEAHAYGQAYAEATIRNARTFAARLHEHGLSVQTKAPFTDSHQVWLDVTDLATPDEAVERLHDANLIANVNLIPTLRAKGLRLGTPEVTRLGMGVDEMVQLADLLVDALAHERPIEDVRADVVALASRFQDVHYAFPLPAEA